MAGWSIRLDRTEWLPEQVHSTGPNRAARKATSELAAKDLVIYERKPYRVQTITLDDPLAWPNSTRERWQDDGMPEPATWFRRPFTLSIQHEPEPDGQPVWLSAAANCSWWMLPEHYAVCRLCGQLPPCADVHTETVMAAEADKMAEEMAILPGCCHECRELVTRRQKVIRFPGANLIRPDLPDGSAVFHLRESCRWGAERYDARWAAAEPGRQRRLYCEGVGRHHHDGSFDCTDPACPGRVRHRSEEWHTLDGTRRGYTSGCWCVSGDLAARLMAGDGQR